MNNIAPGYETFFNWDSYQILLNAVYNNLDYSKIGWSLILVNLIVFTVFYKLWDPVSSSKLKWWLTLLGVGIISFCCTSIILYNNIEITQYLGNYTGENGEPDAHYFIIQMSLISLMYSLIIAVVLSIFPFRLISTNNNKNPF